MVKFTTADPTSRPTAKEAIGFRTIFDKYAMFVMRTLRKLGVASADVHDLCQETFVVIHRRLGDYDGRASMRTWIYAICARTASAYRRAVRSRREDTCEDPEPYVGNLHQVAARQDFDIDARRAIAELDVLLATLDADKRKIVVLHEIEGLSMSQVAEVIGCPLQTAYSRLHAARKLMKESLARHRLSPPKDV